MPQAPGIITYGYDPGDAAGRADTHPRPLVRNGQGDGSFQRPPDVRRGAGSDRRIDRADPAGRSCRRPSLRRHRPARGRAVTRKSTSAPSRIDSDRRCGRRSARPPARSREMRALHRYIRSTAWRWLWPMSISRWWMCSLSAWPMPWPRRVRRTIASDDVEERDEQHEQRHEQRARDGREVAGARRERVPADPGDRRDREQHAEQHRPRVAHEDLGGVEVPREEPDADARP